MKNFFAYAALLALAKAGEETDGTSSFAWNYKQNGADWPDLDTGSEVNECGWTNNSPIDLPWEMDQEPYAANKDMFKKWYTNQESDIVI